MMMPYIEDKKLNLKIQLLKYLLRSSGSWHWILSKVVDLLKLQNLIRQEFFDKNLKTEIKW